MLNNCKFIADLPQSIILPKLFLFTSNFVDAPFTQNIITDGNVQGSDTQVIPKETHRVVKTSKNQQKTLSKQFNFTL